MPINSNLRGRPPFIVTPLSAFTVGFQGNPPIIPYEREFAYDDLGDGSLGFIQFDPDGTTWKFKSSGQETSEFIKDMEYGGIFTNAAAGVMSRDLTYFFFNKDNDSVVLNQNLSYPGEYKYYAIRNGSTYITGKIVNGSVVTNLVDMKTIPAVSGTGFISKPEAGMLLPNASVVDGSNYIIEFFDSAKSMIFRDVFYAESVKTMDNAQTGTVGISKMIVNTTRPIVDKPNSTYLYKGEATQQISLSVYLVYVGGGSSRNIIHEMSNGSGKLQVIGMDTLDTSDVTIATPQKFTVTYYPEPTTNDPNPLAIHQDIDVYILDDETVTVTSFIPLYYIDPTNNARAISHILALRPNGTLVDITYATTGIYVNGSTSSADITPATNTAVGVRRKLELGISGQVPFDLDYIVKCVGNSPIKCGVNIGSINSSSWSDSSNIYGAITYSTSNKTATINAVDVNSLTSLNTTVIGVPTHFAIRNITGDHYFTAAGGTEISKFQNVVFNEGIGASKVVNAGVPVIIEFMNVVKDGNGVVTSSKITNARAAYVTVNN